MSYQCTICGQNFDDGERYAEHVAESHEEQERTIGVTVTDDLIIEDAFGG